MSKNSRTVTSDRSAYSNVAGAAAKVLRSLAVAVQTRAKKKHVPFPFAYTHIQVTHARATRARLTEKISTAEVSAEHTQTRPSRVSEISRIHPPSRRASPPRAGRRSSLSGTTKRLSATPTDRSFSSRHFSTVSFVISSPSRSRGRSWTRSRSTACRRRWPRPRAPPGCRGPPGDAR